MIRVILVRKVLAGLEQPFRRELAKSLQDVVSHPGYVEGESLRPVDDPHTQIVISSWRSLEDWQEWFNSKQRRELSARIRPFLAEDESCTVLQTQPWSPDEGLQTRVYRSKRLHGITDQLPPLH